MASDVPRARQRAKGNSVQVGRSVSGSVINTGAGVSIAIYQAAQVVETATSQPTLDGLVDDILALSVREQKSFAKFIRTEFGGLPLGDVDALALRRVQAYVDAIFDRRDDKRAEL